MKHLSKLLIISVIFLVVCGDVNAKRITSFEKRPNCERTGGVWRQFGNACGDGCRVKFDKFMMCAQALTYSCDCLKDSCFDGEKCVKLDDYRVLFEEIKKEEKALLDQQKDKRSADFEQNRQRILQKLSGIDPNAASNPNAPLDPNNQNQPNVAPPAPMPNNNQRIKPLDIVIKEPKELKNDVQFEVPPFFQKNQDEIKKTLDEKDQDANVENENSESPPLKLPTIPLP